MILYLAKSDKISRRHVQLLHNTFGADKFESALRRKKVKCLNFKIFFLTLCFGFGDDLDSCRFFPVLVIGCHPNFEPIEFKLAHVKRN